MLLVTATNACDGTHREQAAKVQCNAAAKPVHWLGHIGFSELHATHIFCQC